MTWIEAADRTLVPAYGRTPVKFIRGDGVWLYDHEGLEYLDCLTGLAVVAVGHANPRVAKAAGAQLSELVHVSNLFYNQPMVDLAARLTRLSGLDRVFFANCGATANETAIKLARRHAQKRYGNKRYEVVSLLDSFHGRTLATLAATGQPAKQQTFHPLPPGFRQVAQGDINALEDAVDGRTAAILLETTQGEGGVVPLSASYLQAAREICDRKGVLMIVDDVQAGMGRTGHLFSWQGLGFKPDIATVAKAMANGLAMGACLAREKVANAFGPGDHGTTFGGGPVPCSAALAVLDEIEERDLLGNCQERSRQLAEGLSSVDGVVGVRGRGLLLAAILEGDWAAAVTGRALEMGLVVNNVRPNAVRFAPPLTISAAETAEAISRFAAALSDSISAEN
ncbi:MAG: aspartate aminotransferase family protein [bacterium]|nr:aspartate aminotransferase family protein [Acidimicrobiia bacterium]MCY4650191.1 aspartate aminotransferase family protein [bacterium]